MNLRLAVLTTGRQDWGILRSSCRLLKDTPGFDIRLLVGGMHNSKRYGFTRTLIEQDGCTPTEVLAWVGEAAESLAYQEAAAATVQVGNALGRQGVDALMLVGDRLETAAAALAATALRIPIIHLHGGEETLGAFDDALRHAITKLSHLHLVAHPTYRDRVIALGEDPAVVHVVGAPGLDNLHRDDLPGRAELEDQLGLRLSAPVVVVTLHPATLAGDPGQEALAICAAMDRIPATYVITLPNSDPGNEPIRRALVEAARRPGRVAVEALGERRFWGLLRLADAMLGNSSSGLIEAPSLRLPTVNVGDRQKGRLRPRSVIDVPADAVAVADGLRRALEPSFRAALGPCDSLGDGRAAERIRDVLCSWQPPNPPVKRAT
jgi:UDP-hydrolysing UDP-N-acetyl-D-glucosamine 2-epimerase